MKNDAFRMGDMIRSYDFPGLNRKNCFVEGKIETVDQEEGIIEFKCTFDSLGTNKQTRVGDIITIYIESDLDKIWGYPRIEVLAE